MSFKLSIVLKTTIDFKIDLLLSNTYTQRLQNNAMENQVQRSARWKQNAVNYQLLTHER